MVSAAWRMALAAPSGNSRVLLVILYIYWKLDCCVSWSEFNFYVFTSWIVASFTNYHSKCTAAGRTSTTRIHQIHSGHREAPSELVCATQSPPFHHRAYSLRAWIRWFSLWGGLVTPKKNACASIERTTIIVIPVCRKSRNVVCSIHIIYLPIGEEQISIACRGQVQVRVESIVWKYTHTALFPCSTRGLRRISGNYKPRTNLNQENTIVIFQLLGWRIYIEESYIPFLISHK